MKVCIAGSRTIDDIAAIEQAVQDSGFIITELINGACPTGVDFVAAKLAAQHGIPLTLFKPDWDQYGKAAGPIRNRQMAEAADAVIVVWDGQSRGSASMIKAAIALGKPLYIKALNDH